MDRMSESNPVLKTFSVVHNCSFLKTISLLYHLPRRSYLPSFLYYQSSLHIFLVSWIISSSLLCPYIFRFVLCGLLLFHLLNDESHHFYIVLRIPSITYCVFLHSLHHGFPYSLSCFCYLFLFHFLLLLLLCSFIFSPLSRWLNSSFLHSLFLFAYIFFGDPIVGDPFPFYICPWLPSVHFLPVTLSLQVSIFRAVFHIYVLQLFATKAHMFAFFKNYIQRFWHLVKEFFQNPVS